MIPVNRSHTSEDEAVRAKALKLEALRNMEWVYKGASKVLVLDRNIYSLDSSGMEVEELGAHIMCSSTYTAK